MRNHPLHPTLVLVLACLLAVLLFLPLTVIPGAHFWGRYLVPIVLVFLWGRRRDIYIVTVLASVLIVGGYWFDNIPSLDDLLVNHVLPLAILWAVAWLLAQRRQLQEDLVIQREQLLHQQEELRVQMAARTAELQGSERKYRDLFDNSPDMYLYATADDHIIRECNRTLADALGYTPAELVGRPTGMLLTPAFYAAVQAGWSEYVAAGKFANFETQLQRKDGTVLDVLASGHYDPAADGRPAYSRVTFRDITERMRSDTRIHEALQHLQLAAEAAGIGIWNWNFADGSMEWDDRTCDLYAVPADLRHSGVSYEFWRARIHPEDLGHADPDHGDLDRAGDRWSDTYRIVLPDGAVRHIQSAAIKEYDRDGRPLRLIGINRDITDQMRYEQFLKETNADLEQRVAARTADLQAAFAELSAANELKDEFMAMISHELRTPLTGVLSLSELLEEQIAGPLNARQATYTRGIVESGERLLYVINSILGYTHLLSGKLQLEREPCDLGYLIHVCAVSQRAKAAAKQQVVEEAVEPADLSVESDGEAVGEVLKRLLDNAVKFTPAGGRIGLAAHAGPVPGSVQIVVWDTGPGIGSEHLARHRQAIYAGRRQPGARPRRDRHGAGLRRPDGAAAGRHAGPGTESGRRQPIYHHAAPAVRPSTGRRARCRRRAVCACYHGWGSAVGHQVGGYSDGANLLLLHTTGAKTGRPRINSLVYAPSCAPAHRCPVRMFTAALGRVDP